MTKRTNLMAFALTALAAALWVNVAAAKEEAGKEETKTVAGTSGCATCEGVTKDAHSILLTDADG